jgi:hypothetical protein
MRNRDDLELQVCLSCGTTSNVFYDHARGDTTCLQCMELENEKEVEERRNNLTVREINDIIGDRLRDQARDER